MLSKFQLWNKQRWLVLKMLNKNKNLVKLLKGVKRRMFVVAMLYINPELQFMYFTDNVFHCHALNTATVSALKPCFSWAASWQ